MFSTLYFVFIFLNFNFLVYALELYGPHPRIVSDNGNLIIYAADHKNVSIKTTGRGYINLNNENLIPLLKNARNASIAVDRFTTNVIGPLSSNIKSMSDLIYGSDGLLRRVSNLENNVTGGTPLRPFIPRNRNLLQLNRRVRVLEANMMRILNLLTTNDCESNPCKNGGECLDMYNGYICRCSESWTGPSCENDVNECTRFHGTDLGCQNGATCINKPGSYECICAPGWFGLHCIRRTHDCNSGSQDLCGHGTCITQNTPTGYKCICDQGWTTNGISEACTVDVNECDFAKSPVCSVNPLVQCINVPGTFYCGSCPAGYTGNGFYCNDIDECLNYNGGCSMNPKVQCINILGSRICGSCPPGYVGDGISCSFQGVCRINNGGCHSLARCLDNPNIGDNYVQCICPAGYTGTGMGPNGCIPSAISPFVTACSSNPCVHGSCISKSNTSFTCFCQSGYTGKTCNVPIHPCDSNPCQNGATCTNTGNVYTCECTTGYTGENCDKERQACGGKLMGKKGFLQYPSSNNTEYAHSVTCSWVIQTEADQVLNISFTKFHLEQPDSGNNCLYDWVQMHDGPNSASHMIGRFCGRELPKGGQIITTHNSVYVWFRSDHTVSNPGFSMKWNTIYPICGGIVIVQSHGTLKSPGSPGNYPPNRDCEWILFAPYGKRIQFHFFDINIGNNPNCSYDYLKIYSGISTVDIVLAEFCNSSHPEPLITAGSVALVQFHSDASNSYPGFQISYSIIEGIPGCGGIFTADRGEISSPIVDEQYHSYSDCEYKIKLQGNTRIKITFLSFSLEDSISCRYDYVSVHEGGRPDSPLVGRYCGLNIPPSYTSIGNELFIRFKTDKFINDDGFRIKYESVCGGIYDAPSGNIQSSGYPFGTNSIRNCLYEIKQKPGTAIKLTILDMSVGEDICFLDYLEVRDGDTDNSTLIGKYCGRVSPDEIISTHNYLRLRLVTYSGDTNIGFKGNYSTIDLTCGGILKDNLGIIKSPEHPTNYPPNTKCTWIISAPPGFVVQLTWVLFNMEWSMTCSADYMAVYENNTQTGNSALIGKYCGNKLPPLAISTTNLVTLNFVSDPSQSSEGFIVNYNFLDESKTCGGNYFVSTGVIKSPNYPSPYPPYKECVWVITVPHGQQIMLNIEDFDLELYINCGSDYLEIRNGAYSSSPLLGTYCGKDIPKTIPSHTNNLYLKFRSDGTYSKKGFQIMWDGTTTGCGGTLTSPTGQIISPNYPQPYGQNAMCLWKIWTSAGSVLRLMFIDLNLEGQMCRLDYVEIFDGIDFPSKSLGKYCTDTHPMSLTTSNNRAMVKFRSDISHEERGFLLKYLTLCNNTQKGYRGIIESLNFPNYYPKNQNCMWTIEVPLGNKINISFSHFDLEESMHLQNLKTCRFDYVQILEKYEYSPDQILMNKTCGSTLPPLIHSTKNNVNINFVTDSNVHASGFRLEWVVDGCTAILTHPEGKIATPGYPYGYPTETVCEWTIQVDFENAVELTIGKFDFESSSDCTYDSLQIFNGPDENAPLISKVCHTDEKGFIATSTSNTMLVKFISDSSYAGRGFEGHYKTVPSKCGGKYTASMGSIHSRNYPKNYKMKDECEWLIEIAKNHVVELVFHEFDFVSTQNCTSDYIEIYDGDNIDAPLLQTLCGGQDYNGTMKSSRNSLFIRMTTGIRGTAKGFLANYTTGCGTRLVTSTNGMIEIADWGSWECSWTIIADEPDKHVSFTITHLDVSANCEVPALHIYDGLSSEAPLIGNYCGTKAPAMIVSKGSALHIDLSYAYGAYIRAIYSVISTDCGGTMTSISGYFGSLGFPNNYPMNTECQWNINLAPGNKIILTFQEFDLIYSANCNADYVEVREKSASGKLLGIFCGNTVPTNITQTNSLWVQFRSSDIGTAKGFLAEYVLSHGNELFGSKGEIASPLYPMSYGQSDQVTWRITVEFHSVILITFKDFSIDWFAGGECYFLGLEIYDGYDDSSPLLASLCSLQMPEPIRSSSNVMFIKYFTESYRYTLKFLLEWVQLQQPINFKDISKNLSVEGCESDTIIDLAVLNNYTLKSPGFPYGYGGNLKCEWIFSTVPEKHLAISFTDMDLEENNPKCMLDNVKVYTGDDGKPNWRLLNTLCLSNSTKMRGIHTSNLMKVVFKTDAYINKTGFASTIKSECGGSLTDPNGIIEMDSSSFNNRRRIQLQCEWNITVKAGRTIKINFLKFNIQNSEEGVCNINFIMLRNGRYSDSPFLGKGKYCGTIIPEFNATSGNSVYIKYSATTNTVGFKLSYTQVSLACGNHIKLTDSYNTTNISSPNYPDIPPPHTECIWVISAPAGETLQLDFVERFDISYSNNCDKAGVELRDGGTAVSNMIGKVYCTSDIPSTQKTTDNLLYVRFFTDVTDPKNGFKATVSIATCGGIIRGKSGKLRSPYYPAFHILPVNTICTWKIVGPIDHYLNISFNDFQLIYRNNCSRSNHLLITETLPWGNETILATLCGSKKPSDIRTSSNVVTIQMKILVSGRLTKGFSLNFNSSQEACGGTIEADSGFITSPGYPISYHYNRNCEWRIIVPEGRRVTANMIDFDLDVSGYYYTQGIAFFNSKNFKSNIAYMHGNDNRKVMKSSSNIMLVYFWSTGSSNHRGFKLSFNSDESTVCTGDLTKDSGVIETPKTNLTSYFCQWTRRLKENENVFANRTLALIVDAPLIGRANRVTCKYSMTTITVSSEMETELVRQLCGSFSEPQIIRNPYPTTKLTVIQARYHARLNFTITYKVHPCGGILTSSNGIISSPNYPNRYADTVNCAWLIKIEEGQSLKLNFTSMDLDTSCTKDFIDIHNGPSATSPKIGRYCGTNHPSFIQSESNALWIEYHASVGGRGKGFALTFEPIVAGCGGIFHDKQRVIQTPNYPSSYPNNVECIWEIRSEDGYRVGLYFVDRFHIEDSKNCTNDYIEVLDYEDNWVSMGRYCGRIQPQVFNSSSNRLRIVFRSNSQLQAGGFKAIWTFNCGGTYTATESPKYLISPGYPIGYTRELDCKYSIIAPKKYVNIVFEDFVLEEGRGTVDCAFDNVTIGRQRLLSSPWALYRMNNRTDPIYINIGVFCGTKAPPPFRRRDGIRVWFRTDKWVDRKGFKLKYFVDTCGGGLSEEKEISSPLDLTGKSTYYSSINCVWNITAPKDKVVIVKFTFFELEHHHNCHYDNVALYDGVSLNITARLALFCGNITNNLPVIYSTGNNMLIVMKTDTGNQFKGFKANVIFMYSEKSGCGGTINLTQIQPLQTLRSLERSGQYLSNLDCHWLIIAPAEETIELNFNSFHMSPCNTSAEIQKCTCDFLQIRDGGGPLSELMAQPCGHENPTKIISSGSLLWIRMVTDGVESSTGFRATVKKVPSICGKSVLEVTDSKQTLTSPEFPNNYPNNIRCSWILRSNVSSARFEIHFDHLELQKPDAEDKCSTDKLEISDKLSMHSIREGLGQNFIFTGPKSMTSILGVRLPTTSFTYCGAGQPPDFHSMRSEIVITFITDSSITKKGFQLDYRLVGCNRNYTAVQGRLLSEGIVKECIIKISAPANHTISLYFQAHFFINDYQNCKFSGMEIHDGNSSDAPQLAKLCGYQIPNPVFSQNNEIWMKVKSNRRNLVMYDIIYTTTDQGRGCGGELYNYMGRFTSPMYPNNYRNNSVCRWNLSVPRGLRVALKFTIFDLGPINTCETDYVELIDVNKITKEETVTSRYCSADNPTLFFATGNFMSVRYVTSTNNAGSGWIAVFSGEEQIRSTNNIF